MVGAGGLGFCGFYVAKADTKLFNKASQVVLVRDGDRTVMTMVNDFKGDLKEFAVVIPVPTFLQREQIHVGDKALVDHLDAYSAPRLVEYFDEDPVPDAVREYAHGGTCGSCGRGRTAPRTRARSLGVTIEAQYTVGEYDILILSAQQSSGLETWLRENGYRIPPGASAVLSSYLKQNMRFFVAKVNLTEQAKLGFSYLRPLQVAYESPKFMLPIRLGMVNADGAQELFVLRVDAQGTRGDHELPHGEAAIGHGAAGLPEGAGRVCQVLQGHVQPAGRQGRDARAVSRIRMGHELVRSVRRRSVVERRTASTGRVLAGRRRRPVTTAGAAASSAAPARAGRARRKCS